MKLKDGAMKIAKLKIKRDRPTRLGHPWIFSGAIESVSSEPERGETVLVTSFSGDPLGYGAWSPASQIRIRMWTSSVNEPIDDTFFQHRVTTALAIREGMNERFDTNALRLINAEADGLPGVTVDRYGDVLVGQFTTAGAERYKQVIVQTLMQQTDVVACYERSDADGRMREGLEVSNGLLAGVLPRMPIIIRESNVRYGVNIVSGHKTGFYLDQRENRRLIASYAKGRTVLNAFSYTGGFGVAAQVAGASAVTHIDLSEMALEQAKQNTELNGGMADEAARFLQGNAFQLLREFRDRSQTFGLVVLDPPKFADTKSQTMKALRGYKDINLLGIKLVESGGLLATFSCSGAVDPRMFRMVVAEAAHDAGRTVRILHELRQAPDHIEALTFPEGLYLKGLLCIVE